MYQMYYLLILPLFYCDWLYVCAVMKSRDWRPGRRRKGSLPHYLLARPLTVCLTAAVAAAALLLALNVYLLQNVGPKGLTPKSSSSPDVHHEEYAKPRGEPHLPRPILWLHYKTVLNTTNA